MASPKRDELSVALRRMSPDERWRAFVFVVQALAGAPWFKHAGHIESWRTVLGRQVPKRRRRRTA
jgi:hypothetical protein